jgi:hypothetical protein
MGLTVPAFRPCHHHASLPAFYGYPGEGERPGCFHLKTIRAVLNVSGNFLTPIVVATKGKTTDKLSTS